MEMVKEIKNNLKIVNMVLSGKMPFKRKLSHEEYNKLIMKFNWISVNDEISPILSKRVPIRKKKRIFCSKKRKTTIRFYMDFWAIVVLGVVSRKEANEIYNIIIKELKRVCPSILK